MLVLIIGAMKIDDTWVDDELPTDQIARDTQIFRAQNVKMTAVVLMLALGSFLEYSNSNNLIMLFINLCVATSYALHAGTDPKRFDFLLGVVEIITYAQLIYLAKWLRSGGLLLIFSIVKLATYGCLKTTSIIFYHFKDVPV